ncbi:hypothetical protein O7599_04975 [Streptomyces sp. WMMC500]|uniref:hypothetical protein n=1 Tax=Streptomyces sp. WMMC500 TaxID=3015154 RepID=UPI00248C66CF|nr:hypothetical protein [Streptomyces sp. WMMC500]WBB61906.1 hypothetical protein O7599_04975 [Streptomyces sp. WMMC500]
MRWYDTAGHTPVLLTGGLLTVAASLAALAVPGAHRLSDPRPRGRAEVTKP